MSTLPHSLQSTVNGSNWLCSDCVKVDLEEKNLSTCEILEEVSHCRGGFEAVHVW